jgi:hypothetical protein
MADIKLVIKISEEEYKWIIQSEKTVFADIASKECMLHAIKNGTPLPKGHGRLVDMSEVLIKLMQFYDGDKTIGQCLDEVNTIIEADKGRK